MIKLLIAGLFIGIHALASTHSFIKVDQDNFAYRKMGVGSPYPLILLMHTRGNMDGWDPQLLDLLAKKRTVIVFDNRGVGLSRGVTPQSFKEMATDAAKFIKALGYKKVDLLGFSIGGAVAQELLTENPDLIRKAILAGTSAAGGSGVNQISSKSQSVSTKKELTDDDLLYAFFAPSAKSQQLGKAYLKRIKQRSEHSDVPVTLESAAAQAKARESWGAAHPGNEAELKKMNHPILVANGKDDIRMPTINSYNLFNLLPNAKLILYPDSGHGFLFQYPEACGRDFNNFLDEGL